MENEIMNNEEVMTEVVEEVAPTKAGKGLIAVAVAGVVILGGRMLYKKVIKPAIAKAKAKKAAKEGIEVECEELPVEIEDSEEI